MLKGSKHRMAGEKTAADRRYLEFKEMTEEIAASVGPPRFYSEKDEAVAKSCLLFSSQPVLKDILISLTDSEDYPGHGLSHIKKVARDAGALILLDGGRIAEGDGLTRLVFLAQLAGLLHDIRRSEPHHAQRGAEEAVGVLKALDLTEAEVSSVVQAIANHEAFQPAKPLDDPAAQLLSDALYDGDKFRWGPDNFTETLWSIVITRQLDLKVLAKHFPRGIEATERIRTTFRTRTGMEYGPDFIDRALEIGRRIYARLSSSL